MLHLIFTIKFLCYAVFTILNIRTESTGVIDSEKSFGANFLEGFDYLYHNTLMLVILKFISSTELLNSSEALVIREQ